MIISTQYLMGDKKSDAKLGPASIEYTYIEDVTVHCTVFKILSVTHNVSYDVIERRRHERLSNIYRVVNRFAL
jgi:hypothetical protein